MTRLLLPPSSSVSVSHTFLCVKAAPCPKVLELSQEQEHHHTMQNTLACRPNTAPATWLWTLHVLRLCCTPCCACLAAHITLVVHPCTHAQPGVTQKLRLLHGPCALRRKSPPSSLTHPRLVHLCACWQLGMRSANKRSSCHHVIAVVPLVCFPCVHSFRHGRVRHVMRKQAGIDTPVFLSSTAQAKDRLK